MGAAGVVMRADEGRSGETIGEKFLVKLTADQSGGTFALAQAEFAPRHGTFFHRHMKSGELFYILSGTVIVDVDDDVYHLGGGDLAYVPPGARHRITNVGDTPATFLGLYAPSGPDAGMREIARLFAESGGKPDLAAVAAAAAANDIVDRGPARMRADA